MIWGYYYYNRYMYTSISISRNAQLLVIDLNVSLVFDLKEWVRNKKKANVDAKYVRNQEEFDQADENSIDYLLGKLVFLYIL